MQDWQQMFIEDLNQQAHQNRKTEPIGLMENIRRGGWGGFFDRATFGTKQMVEAARLYNATQRFRLDDYPRTEDGWQHRKRDKKSIIDYLKKQAELSERDLTVPAKVGTVVFDMLPYMAEFFATGGITALGKEAATKSILKLAGRYAEKSAVRTAAKIGGTMASAAVRTAILPQHIAGNYFQNRLPQMSSEDGKLFLSESQQSPAKAFYRAIGNQYIELLSEESGAGISKVFGSMAKGIMPKGVHTSASKLMNSLRKTWIKAAPGRDSIAFAKRMSERAGFHGILEEMGEERLGDILKATFNIKDYGKKDNNLIDRLAASIPDGEQLLVEALAFSVPGAGRAALAAGHEFAQDRDDVKKNKEFLLSPNGAEFIRQNHGQLAEQIASKDQPTRKDFAPLGKINFSKEERARLAGLLRKPSVNTSENENPKLSVIAEKGSEEKIIEKWGTDSRQAKAVEDIRHYISSQSYKDTGYFNKWVNKISDSAHIDKEAATQITEGAMHNAYIEAINRLKTDGSGAAIEYAQSWADEFNVPFAEGFLFGIKGLFRREAARAMRAEQAHGKAVRITSEEESGGGQGISEQIVSGKKPAELHDDLKLRVRDSFERLQSLLPNYLGQNRIKSDDANFRILAEISDEILADPEKTPLTKAEHARYLKTRQSAINLRMRPFAAYRKSGGSKDKLQHTWQQAREYLHSEAQRRWKNRNRGKPATSKETTASEDTKGITKVEVKQSQRYNTPLWTKYGVPGWLNRPGKNDSWRWILPDRSKSILIIDPDAEYVPGSVVQVKKDKNGASFRWMVHQKGVNWSRMLTAPAERISRQEAEKRRGELWRQIQKTDKTLAKKITPSKQMNASTADSETAMEWAKKMFARMKQQEPETTGKWLKEAVKPARAVYDVHRTWTTDADGNPVTPGLGRYTDVLDAKEAYRVAYRDRFGVEPETDIKDAPRLWAWPDWDESQKWLDKALAKPAELTVIGRDVPYNSGQGGMKYIETSPEFDKMFDKLTRNKWISQIGEIEFTNDNPIATEKEAISSNGQRWTNEQRQNKRSLRVAGRTHYSKSSGRIRITIGRGGLSSPGVFAEEVHHIGLEIIRQSMPGAYRQAQRWYADRIAAGADPTLVIDEAFVKEMSLAERGRRVSLPKDLQKIAQDLAARGGKLKPVIAAKVIAAFGDSKFSITENEGDTALSSEQVNKFTPADFASGPAQTKEGVRLLRCLDPQSSRRGLKKAGPRSIVEFVNNLVHTEMLVAKSQTTGRHPAHFEILPHIIRSRSGIWQLNFHEAGHALSNLLADSDRSWKNAMNQKLIDLTRMTGSMASSKSAEEGMAELVRRYIVDYNSVPDDLRTQFEDTLENTAPDILAGLRDAHRAYTYWRSTPITHQLNTIQADQPPTKSKAELIQDLIQRALYSVLGGSTVIDRVIRDAHLGIAGGGKLAAADITGITSLIKAKFDKAYRAQLKLAADFRELTRDTPSDIESAYQSTIHITQEVQRAVYGVQSGREGIRVPSTGKGFNSLPEAEIKILRQGGFELPEYGTEHGDWIYLSGKSISKIKHEIGLDKWENFSLYGQYRAALERYKNKRHDYPGRVDGLTPEVLADWLREQEEKNPDWKNHFDEIQKYMNQLLLVSVLSGEKTASEAVAIKKAWEDYWPLPRQMEGVTGRFAGGGAEPDSGIRSAHGSPLPFKSLDDALESRTKMAMEAYYINRLMLAMRNFNRTLGGYQAAPFDVRKDALRIMLPLKLEAEKVARLTDLEQGQIIADYLNDQFAKSMNISVEELKKQGSDIRADEVEISTPGRAVWRMDKPRAVHIIAPFEKGRRKYYQLTDPLLFDLLSKGKSPSKYFNWLTHAMTAMIAPWRRALTQNIGFALANSLSRDPANAGFMGKDNWKSLIPYFYAGTGLVNRLKGNSINTDAMSQSELLSKALDHTSKDAHQGIVGSFKEMLKEGIAIQNWHDMTVSAKLSEVPGELMSVIMKPIDIFNWISGGRWISQVGEELPREGAFIAAQKRGESPERAQMQYDYITGNFGQKGGSPAIAATVRSAGFLNPGLQIMSGQLSRTLDPDPKVRAFNIGAKIPALMTWGAIGAAVNYLIIHAVNPDDDERKAVLDQMRERPDENRLGYMAIAGKIRLPFDYGLIGASVSYGWNSTEQWLLDEPISAQKKAKVLLNRARDIPGITDIINPYIKTGAELWLNHSFFYDSDIVPAWMEAAYPYNPQLQTWPNMAKVYQAIGTGLKVSPIKIKYAVGQLFTRQMDDAVKLIEKLSGGRPYAEGADLPVVGRLIDRKSVGFQSQSVKTLVDLDSRWQKLNQQYNHLIKTKGDRKELRELKIKMAELNRAHKTMLYISKIWKAVKTESARPKPDKARINQLKKEMTRRAKLFMKRHQKAA